MRPLRPRHLRGTEGEKHMSDFGEAPIKMEGGIADPDAFTWSCACGACKARYQRWKEAFDAQQKQLKDPK
jgi:hypothetical protein